MQIHFDYIHGPALRVLAKALIEIAEIQEQAVQSIVPVGAMSSSDVTLAAQQKQDLANAAANREDDAAREAMQAKRDEAKKSRKAAASAEAPKQSPSAGAQPQETTATTASPSEPARTVSLEEVRAVCAAKSNSGKAADVKALLKEFGAAKLTDVDPAKFADLLTAAEAL